MKTKLMLLIPFVFLSMGFAQDNTPTRQSGHGWLGVSVRDMTPRLAKEEGIKAEHGAYINDVLDESPADKAGLKEGDVILEYNGKKMDDADDLVEAVHETAPGSTVAVVVLRDGENKSVQVTVAKARRERFGAFPFPHGRPDIHIFRQWGYSGMHLMDLNEQLAEYFGAPDRKGVLVEEVDEGSAADKAGFKAGDVIVKAGKSAVEDKGDVDEALEDARAGDKVDFGVLRKGSSVTLTLTMEKRRHERFHSDEFPGMKEKFHMDFDKLKIELQGLGRSLKDEMQELKKKLQEEFGSSWS